MKYIFYFLMIFLFTCNKKNLPEAEKPDTVTAAAKQNGFYWLVSFPMHEDDNAAKFQNYINYLQTTLSADTSLKGITIYADWNKIEPAERVYNQDVLQKLDAVIQTAKNNNRKYKIALATGRRTPQYLYNMGVPYIETVITNPYNRDYGDSVDIPVPWDEVYLKNYYRNIRFLADRYNADTSFIATTIAVATANSPEWIITPNANAMLLWSAYSNIPQRMDTVWKNAIDSFAKIYPQKQICIEASSFPFPNMINESRAILQYGCDKLQQRFSIQINQLQGNIDMINALSYQNVYLFKSKMHPGLQSLSSWKYEASSERFGSMEMVVYNYIQSGAKYWELWEGDGSSLETMKKLNAMLSHAQSIGLSAYKNELIQKGQYKGPN